MENKYDIFISYRRDKVFLEDPSGRAEHLYSSFSVPLVPHRSTYGDLKDEC